MFKKIDMHAHTSLFTNTLPPSYGSGERLVSPEELLKMYDELGIERGVLQTIISPEANSTVITSECLKAVCDQYPNRFLWFCGVDPRGLRNRPDSDLSYLLNHYKAQGAKGVGEVTANLYIDDPLVDNLFAHCAAAKMPVTIHMHSRLGGSYGLVDDPGLPRMEAMLQKHPDLILIGHSVLFWLEIASNGREGKVQEGRLAQIMRRCPNLYCDISAGSGCRAMTRDADYTVAFLTEFQDRVLYGCDITSTSADHPYILRDFLEELHAAGRLTDEVYYKILRGNAEKLLGL